MMMPNFLVIGAAKSGTTSLYYYLRQHPEVYMSPIKEPHFFSFEGEQTDFRGPGDQEAARLYIKDIKSYCDLFQKASREKAIGEASNSYIYYPKAAQRIKLHIPQARLIAILRNPIDRAFSSFLHLVRDSREFVLNFREALELEEKRIKDNWFPLWHYKQRGFYYQQLKYYYQLFDSSQIKIELYDDLQSNPLALLKDLFNFLDVDTSFVPNISATYNVSVIPKYKFVYEFLKNPNFVKNPLKLLFPPKIRGPLKQSILNSTLYRPELTVELRKELAEIYQDDILKLQGLIQRDLSHWLLKT